MKKLLVITEYSYPNDIVASHRYEQLGKYISVFGYKMEILSVKVNSEDLNRSFFLCQYNHYAKSEITKHWVENIYPKIIKSRIVNKIREFLYFVNYGKYPYYVFKAFYEKAENIIDIIKPDIILASAPGGIPLNVAVKIKKEFNIPVVVDFRDILNEISTRNTYKTGIKKIASKRENRLLKEVDGFLTVSEHLKKNLSNRCFQKGIVLMNGFDPADFSVEKIAKNKKMRLIYAGNFYIKDGRDPFILFDAIDLFLEKYPKAEIEIEFYGGETLSDFYKGRLCEGIIKEYDRIGHKDMLAKEQNADVLLFFTNPAWKGILTGKLPEYLGTGNTILAIPGDYDVVRDVINETNTGLITYNAHDGFKAIEKLYKEWKKNGYIINNSNKLNVLKFSRKNQAKKLAEFLNQIIENR